jgi:hypothetical protein
MQLNSHKHCCQHAISQKIYYLTQSYPILPNLTKVRCAKIGQGSKARMAQSYPVLIRRPSPCMLFQREPATPGQVPGASREAPDRWTTYAVRYLPKCLYFQANPQRTKMAMTGFLPCSILAEKAKLLKTKEL